jgi:hypothetical protein
LKKKINGLQSRKAACRFDSMQMCPRQAMGSIQPSTAGPPLPSTREARFGFSLSKRLCELRQAPRDHLICPPRRVNRAFSRFIQLAAGNEVRIGKAHPQSFSFWQLILASASQQIGRLGQIRAIVRGFNQMLPSGFCLSFLLICLASATAFAKDKGPTLRDQQQAACYNDAQKLCGDFIPDIDKVTACMVSKQSQVSAGCAKYFNADHASK